MIQELEKKVELLDEYSRALEKENFAKNQQTATIYHQLESYQQENQMLKGIIEAYRQKSQQKPQLAQTNTRESLRNFGEDLRNSSTLNGFKQIAEEMQEELTRKEEELNTYMSENQELASMVQRLEEELHHAKEKVTNSEEKLRKNFRRIKCLQQTNYELRSNLEESRNVSFCRLEVDKLVKENNQLIERLRMLEKEKNIYYTELKCVSPMKIHQSTERSMGKSLIQNSRKKVSNKGERWNLIEEKLKLIRQENEQLKANLEIN